MTRTTKVHPNCQTKLLRMASQSVTDEIQNGVYKTLFLLPPHNVLLSTKATLLFPSWLLEEV